MMTSMKSAAQIWAATKQAMRAVPVLLQAPQVWVQRVEAEGGTRDAALRFWVIAAGRPRGGAADRVGNARGV